MNREEVIRMAREAGISPIKGRIGDDFMDVHWSELERFAVLVAAAERERCCLAIYDATDNMHDEQAHVMKEMHCDAIRALP